MKATVISSTPVVPEQVVELELSIQEFAVLERLRWKHLDGFGPIRTSIEEAFEEAIDDLHPHWADKVRAARDLNCQDVDAIEEVFGL